jgi:hypothetical protein
VSLLVFTSFQPKIAIKGTLILLGESSIVVSLKKPEKIFFRFISLLNKTDQVLNQLKETLGIQ